MTSPENLNQSQFANHAYSHVIGMVPTDTLHDYREYDRPVKPDLAADIAAHGIREPLVLEYSKHTGEAMLGEGNHRLAAARALGITHVPVRAVRVTGPLVGNSRTSRGGRPVPTRVEPNQHGYVPGDLHPRQLGL